MLAGLAALAMLADGAAAGAAPSSAQAAAAAAEPAEQSCAQARASADQRQIVICGQKPQGYRLNPDVMEAKRELHGGGRPHNPHEIFTDRSCGVVGPAPCFNAGINLLAAAVTAAEMAKRLSEGKEIGSMFLTDPHPDEYHLYLAAKARREAREAEAAAAARAKAAAAAKAQAGSAPTK